VKWAGNEEKRASVFTGDKGSFLSGFYKACLDDFTIGCSTFMAFKKLR